MLIVYLLAAILHGSTPAIAIADELWTWFHAHVILTILLILFLA